MHTSALGSRSVHNVGLSFGRILPAVLAGLLGMAVSGCEDNNIGRPCEVTPGSDAGAGQDNTIINDTALECPDRICLAQAKEGAGAGVDTEPVCTALCNSDSDCENSERRDETDGEDLRCAGRFVCGVATVVGESACKKLCLCSDFFGPEGYTEPPSCGEQAMSNP